MSDASLSLERLQSVLTALERIPRRFEGISQPSDFQTSDAGIDRMNAICMILMAAGEEFKKIDRQTEGKLFARYPQLAIATYWRMVILI